jgi:hypothetical protein
MDMRTHDGEKVQIIYRCSNTKMEYRSKDETPYLAGIYYCKQCGYWEYVYGAHIRSYVDILH